MDSRLQIQALYSLLKEERKKLLIPNYVKKLYGAALGNKSEEISCQLELLDKLADMTTLCLMQEDPHRAIRFLVAFKHEASRLEKLTENGLIDAAESIF